MSHILTNNNHYNPCFWTAYWNELYYETALKEENTLLKPRDQKIFSLNFYADKIFPSKMEKVHFDKNIGVAEITPESMKRFCARWAPLELEKFSDDLKNHPENLIIDFEDILTGIEQKCGYDSLIQFVKTEKIESVQHKGFLSCLFVYHALRSYEMMNAMINNFQNIGVDKWEYFWLLKNAWGNSLILARAVTPIAFSQWIIYRTDKHKFPLCDSPVMVNQASVMVVLSPRLLLEITLNVKSPEDIWKIKDGISSSKYREFRRRSIQNSFREIIFHDESELQCWRKTKEYKSRVSLIRNKNSRQALIQEAASRVIWIVNGCGKVPNDFEEKISPFLNADFAITNSDII